jgi:hypothetical protein
MSAVVRLSSRLKLTIALVGAGLWASGGLWLICRYFLRTVGAYGPEPHILEPWWLAMHGFFAFATLIVCGMLLALHVGKAWRSRRRRWSGGLLLAGLTFLTITGYLLIYGTDSGAWNLVTLTHWGAGLALPLLYAAHRLLRLAGSPQAAP